MPSISKSEPILKVSKLGLRFRLRYYRTQAFRDLFVQTVKDPWAMLTRAPESFVVFDDVSFSLFKGDRVGLIGLNGAGKSSLCRCIAGIYGATRGTLELKGNCRAVFDTGIGIQPELTGRENAELLSELLYGDIEHNQRKALLEEALAFTELESFLDTPFKFYSNGMQARLCLSLVSAMPADLLILDEVFDGADQFFRKKIGQRIRQTIEKSGAVIFVSHSIEQVQDVCNRVILLHDRKVLFDGSPSDAYQIYNGLKN